MAAYIESSNFSISPFVMRYELAVSLKMLSKFFHWKVEADLKLFFSLES